MRAEELPPGGLAVAAAAAAGNNDEARRLLIDVLFDQLHRIVDVTTEDDDEGAEYGFRAQDTAKQIAEHALKLEQVGVK